jgi:hypothetical protein
MKLTLLSLIAILTLTGCTQQQRAKQFGGKFTESLPAGRKLVNVTWKGDHLWYLTRPMTTNDIVETYTFKESSSWGLVQGEIDVVESR